jgi:hypothetical protein
MATNSKALTWWSKLTGRTVKNRGQLEDFPTHSRVVLPDGDIMLVRNASLTAAKDLLAAQRAAERKLAAHRLLQEALDGVASE